MLKLEIDWPIIVVVQNGSQNLKSQVLFFQIRVIYLIDKLRYLQVLSP